MNLAYVKKQIERISQYGDNCLWRIASNCDLFDDELAADGTLTPEQRATVLDFIANLPTEEEWQASQLQSTEIEPTIDCDSLSYPESEYYTAGLDLGTAYELSESWRRGESLPDAGHPEADQVSDKLNKITNQPLPLAKYSNRQGG